jgi:hypothetical protein
VCASWEAIAADWHSDLCKKGFSQLRSLSRRLRREIALSIWDA